MDTNDADYKIKYETRFRGKGMKDNMIFQRAKPILYLSVKRVFNLYKKNGKSVGDTTLPTESLRFYLENSKEYLGTKNSVRFKPIPQAPDRVMSTTDSAGQTIVQATSRTDWALCFDYSLIAENYGINLEVETANDDDVDPTEIDENDLTMPY